MKKLFFLSLLIFVALNLNCKDETQQKQEITIDIMGQIQEENEFDENQNP